MKVTLPFCCSWKKIEEEYGIGVRLYFDFGKLIIALNFVLLFVQLINYIPHLVIDSNSNTTSLLIGKLNIGVFFDLLYGSSFDPSLYWLWVSTNA